MDASGRVSLPRSKAKNNINVKTDGDIKEDKKCTFRRIKDGKVENTRTSITRVLTSSHISADPFQLNLATLCPKSVFFTSLN